MDAKCRTIHKMHIGFNERDFEREFGFNLRNSYGGTVSRSPSLFEEKFLGVDEVTFVNLEKFNDEITRETVFQGSGRFRSGSGIRPRDIEFFLEHKLWQDDGSKYNLFVQYKVPEFLITKRARQWHYWGKEFFRFPITEHQQEALYSLSTAIGSNAFVVYASPAFSGRDNLENHAKSGSIVANSHVVEASLLGAAGRHHTYSYMDSKSKGYANSEPEEIEGRSLEFLVSLGDELNAIPTSEFLISTSETVTQISSRLSTMENFSDFKERHFDEVDGSSYPILSALINVRAFCAFWNLKSYIF